MPELKNEFSKTAGSFVILYTNNEVSERETKKKPFTIVSPKQLGINLTRDLKGPHTENAKTLIKETEQTQKNGTLSHAHE